MLIEGKGELPEEEIEEIEEELDLFDFMVEDKEPTDDVCMTCVRHKVGSQVCGIYKVYNDFVKSKGKTDIEDRFSCSEYKEV